jgi:hypothetical protein
MLKSLIRYSKFTPLLLIPTVAYGECNYDRDVSSVHVKKIEQTNIEKRKVIDFHGAKKCLIIIRSKVDGEWHRGMSSFVFDTSMAEDEACDRAITRAKDSIYRRVSPEMFSSTTSMKCNTKIGKTDNQLKIPLPHRLPKYGEVQEVVLNKKCKLVEATVQYGEGYRLKGYKEVCND